MEFKDLQRILSDVFECEPALITETSSTDTIEAWDSLRMLDLLMALEQQAGVEIDTERLSEMTNVPAILALVGEARAA